MAEIFSDVCRRRRAIANWKNKENIQMSRFSPHPSSFRNRKISQAILCRPFWENKEKYHKYNKGPEIRKLNDKRNNCTNFEGTVTETMAFIYLKDKRYWNTMYVIICYRQVPIASCSFFYLVYYLI